MATRDVLVLNTTASRAETQQGSDTVVIRGNSGEALSVENSSGTSILSVNTVSSSVDIAGKITATGNVTASSTSTGSFGRIEATTLIGDAFNLTNTAIPGTISSSGQIASQISGAFRHGFEFTGTIGDSTPDQQNKVTASFGRIVAISHSGSAAGLTNTDLDNTISSSAQIASQISGAFTSGFDFDGTIQSGVGAWSATNPINQARNLTAGFGSQNATVLVGGNSNPVSPGAVACSETWNGTNWSEGNDLNQKRMGLGGVGTTTAGLVFGGSASPGNDQADTETYNGTNYSEVNNLTTGRYALEGFGTQNSAIAAGGAVPNYNNLKALTEEWNGTNWSEVNDLPYNTWYGGTAGDSSESGIWFGGSSPNYLTGNTKTTCWNGTNWSEVADLNLNRVYIGGNGTTNNAIAVGGLKSPYNGGLAADFTGTSEKWNGTTWSIGATMNVVNRYAGVGGSGNGAIAAGLGSHPTYVDNSELYEPTFTTGSFTRIDAITLVGDGTELTNIASANTISGSAQIASQISGAFTSGFSYQGTISGSSTSTGSFGRLEATTLVGDVSGMSNLLKTGIVSGSAQLASQISGAFTSGFEFDNSISGSVTSTGSFGTTTVGKAIGNISAMTNIVPSVVISGSKQISSQISGSFNKGFEFSGTIETSPAAWSVGANMPGNYYGGAGAGRTQNAALHWSGRGPSSNSVTNCSQEWNGTSWSGTNNFNKSLRRHSGAGTTESALSVGGYSHPTALDSTEYFNGTNWAEKATLPHAQMDGATVGEDADILLVGGGNHPGVSSVNTDKYSLSGNTWSQETDAPTNVGGEGAAGTSEAAIIPIFSPSEGSITYNGSNWSEIASTLTNRGNGVGIFGTQNNAVAVGGCSNAGVNMGCTEIWNGTSWTYGSSMNNGRGLQNGRTVGTATAGLAFSTAYSSVSGPAWSCDTELWNDFISTGSFGRLEATSMHGDISNMTDTAKAGFLSSSVQIADQISGSFKGGISTTGGHIGYGGVWSVGGAAVDGGGSNINMTTLAMWGNNQAAGLATGNKASAPWGGTYTYFAHYQYNGTNWSLSPHCLNFAKANSVAVGQQDAATRWGGSPGNYPMTECYNGSAWTSMSEMVWPNAQRGGDVGESSDSAAQFGGCVPTYYHENRELGVPLAKVARCHQEWNGSTWSIGSGNRVEMNLGSGGAGGTVNSAFFYTTPHQMCAHKNNPKTFETWDGIAWTLRSKVPPKLVHAPVGFGTANDAVVAGGTFIPYYPNTINPNRQEDTYAWDGISWKVDGAKLNQPRQAAHAQSNFGGGVGTSNALAVGGGHHPSTGNYGHLTEHYDRGNGIPSTGSFFEVTASSAFSADLTLASGITFPEGTLSGSAQIASRVSGSFNQRYVFDCNFGGGGGIWYATGLRNRYYEARYAVGGGTVNAGWLAGGTHVCNDDSNYYWEKFDGMSWTTAGGQMLKPRCGLKGGGSQNAGVAFGGCHRNPNENHSVCTEEMNGITWSEVNNLSTGKGLQQGGWGEQTAALSIGGDSSPGAVTEQWDGLNWSNQVSTPYPITQYYDGIGTVNAGGQFVGTACGPAPTSPNYYWNEWNGSTWSEGNKNISAREHAAMFGKVDSAVIYGGRSANTGGGAGLVEEYDGTGWSLLSSIPRNVMYHTGHGIGGSSAAGVAAGGYWDPSFYKGLPMTPTGYSATPSATLSFAFERNLTCVVNTHTASIADEPFMQNRYPLSSSIDSEHHNECSRIGNVTADTLQINNNTDIQVEESMQMPIFYSNPPVTSSAGEVWYNATEEKLYFTYDINSWSDISAQIVPRNSGNAIGHLGATLTVGGDKGTGSPYASQCTELWNGNVWTELNDTNEEQAGKGLVGTAFGAFLHSGIVAQGTEGNELWNGTNWSAGPDGGIAVGASMGNGTANASIHTGGADGSGGPHDDTVEWNGTTFSVSALLPTAKKSHGQAGTQNAAYVFGGRTPTTVATTEKYNGTSWSTDVELPSAVRNTGGSGTSNATLQFGGVSTAVTNEYNGVAWNQASSLSNARYNLDGAGSQASTIAVGGSAPGGSETYTTTGIGCACIGGV